MSKKKVCVIMVNYNNSQLSIDCYNSLVSQKKDINLTLIVVDNNSSEKEKNILRAFQTKYMDFEVLYLDSNIGYFPGMAKGQEYAYKKGEYEPISLDYYLESLVYVLTHISPDVVIHKVSGDAPKDLLVAPSWNVHKKWILNGLDHMLRERDLYQGMFF